LARVATDLQDAQLAVEFNLETATEGWQFFSITFDPAKGDTLEGVERRARRGQSR